MTRSEGATGQGVFGRELRGRMFNREKQELKRVPMMPVRDMVIFPQMMKPFIVGREACLRALEEALAGDKKIFLATQHDASVDDPKPEEIYAVGTLANIVQSVRLPDGNMRVLVEGVERARAVSSRHGRRIFPRHAEAVPTQRSSLLRRSSRRSTRSPACSSSTSSFRRA